MESGSLLLLVASSSSDIFSLVGLNVGMGARACSRNSRMVGVMMVSSGMLCSVIHAVSVPFLPLLLSVELSLGVIVRSRLSSVLEM